MIWITVGVHRCVYNMKEHRVIILKIFEITKSNNYLILYMYFKYHKKLRPVQLTKINEHVRTLFV